MDCGGRSTAVEPPASVVEVSVIVPVYNAAPFLDDCVDSLLAQTFTPLEIILVDDGSTDGSGEACDSFASAHGQIRVFHKPNGGMSDARNAGLDVARGRYIVFVDADDAVAPEMITTLYRICEYEKVTLACCGSKEVLEVSADDLNLDKNVATSVVRLMSGREAVEEMLYQCGVNNSVWSKMFSRSLWETRCFRKGIGYEDLDVIHRVMLDAGRVAVTDACLYLYRQHRGSYIHSFQARRADVLDVTDRMLQWVAANEPELAEAARCRRMSAHINILGLMHAARVRMPEVEARCRSVIAADSALCRRNPRAKPQMRKALTTAKWIGLPLFAAALGWAYRRKDRRKFACGKA